MKKHHLTQMALICGAALTMAPAMAQTTTTKARVATKAVTKAPASEAKTVAVASNVKASAPVSRTTVHAAGSVIELADGVVARVTLADFPTPAPGFVYEN